MAHVGKKLKSLRLENKKSITSVCLALNVSRTTYHRLEKGLLKVDEDIIERAIYFYKVDANYFFDISLKIEYHNREATVYIKNKRD